MCCPRFLAQYHDNKGIAGQYVWYNSCIEISFNKYCVESYLIEKSSLEFSAFRDLQLSTCPEVIEVQGQLIDYAILVIMYFGEVQYSFAPTMGVFSIQYLVKFYIILDLGR